MIRLTSSQQLARAALLDRIKRAGMKGVPALRSTRDLHAKDLLMQEGTPPIKWDRQTQRWYYIEPVNLLCIRDPDWENEYTADAPINEITIDIGGQWESYKHFASDLYHDRDEATEYEHSLLEEVSDLKPNNPVRMRVEEFFADARANANDR